MKLNWIDFENTLDVLYFRPLIADLEKRGDHVLLSAHDAFNVFELLERFNMRCLQIGRHYGRHVIMKGYGLMVRATQLNAFVRQYQPMLAVSHVPMTELKTTVTRGDGAVALEGKALCYTMPLPSAAS